MLAAQKRVLDLSQDKGTPLITAINSDVSMLNSYVGKDNEKELAANLIPQETRAHNIAIGLARMFPDHPIVVVMYDEITPFELYQALSQSGFGMKSLYKIGFMIEKDEEETKKVNKPIIGAKFFEKVYAFKAYDDRPVMFHDTRDVQPTDRYPDVVEDLRDTYGPHNRPYLSRDGKVLFPVPTILRDYAAPDKSEVVQGYHLKR